VARDEDLSRQHDRGQTPGHAQPRHGGVRGPHVHRVGQVALGGKSSGGAGSAGSARRAARRLGGERRLNGARSSSSSVSGGGRLAESSVDPADRASSAHLVAATVRSTVHIGERVASGSVGGGGGNNATRRLEGSGGSCSVSHSVDGGTLGPGRQSRNEPFGESATPLAADNSFFGELPVGAGADDKRSGGHPDGGDRVITTRLLAGETSRLVGEAGGERSPVAVGALGAERRGGGGGAAVEHDGGHGGTGGREQGRKLRQQHRRIVRQQAGPVAVPREVDDDHIVGAGTRGRRAHFAQYVVASCLRATRKVQSAIIRLPRTPQPKPRQQQQQQQQQQCAQLTCSLSRSFTLSAPRP
jgi:hypothetical protein